MATRSRPTGAAQLPVTSASLTLTPACPVPVPPATAPARAFTATTGLLMHQVTATRVADFEIARDIESYLRGELKKLSPDTPV